MKKPILNTQFYSFLVFITVLLGTFACEIEEDMVPNEPPTVSVGSDQTTDVGEEVLLQATASDPEGAPLTVLWSFINQPAGSTASINNASSLNASFVPDVAGTYTLQLSVNDSQNPPVTDQMTVVAEAIITSPPVPVITDTNGAVISEANENDTIEVDLELILSAQSTTDPDTDYSSLRFDWEVIEAPEGSETAEIAPEANTLGNSVFKADVAGEYLIRLTVTDLEENSAISEVVVTATSKPIVLGCVNGDLLFPGEMLILDDWREGIDYIVNCAAKVTGDLMINSGVEIQFGAGAGLVIEKGSAIFAEGEADNPITFTGEDAQAGSWKGILSYSESTKNLLRYVTIAYAGGGAFNSNDDEGAIILWADAKMRIENCTIEHSAAYGINATYQDYAVEIENPTIRFCETPMYLDANLVGSISGGQYEENDNDVVRVLGGTHKLTDDQQWTDLGVPYQISAEGEGDFKNLVVENATLTIDPGVTLAFENGTGMFIGESDASALVAVGAQEKPIRFTGVTQVAGAWGGIDFSRTNSPLNEISHATIEYAGAPGWGGAIVMWGDPTLRVKKLAFENIKSCAFLDAPKKNLSDRNPNFTVEEECDACSNYCVGASDDKGTLAAAPSALNYASSPVEATYFQAGSSEAPAIDWNNSQGNFELGTFIEGLSIDAETGVLSWTNELPPGSHKVQVTAANIIGHTSVWVTLNNPVQGVLTGTFDNNNGSSFFEITFRSNGTLLVRAGDQTSPNVAYGTWSYSNSGYILTTDYTYTSGGEFSTSGGLYIRDKVSYMGDWYIGHGSVGGNKGGTFEVFLN